MADVRFSKNARPTLLIVDDEYELRVGVTRLFEAKGFDVTAVETGREAVARLTSRPSFDVAILDVMMDDTTGFSVLREVRGAGVMTPILLLTVEGEEDQKVIGFSMGADDYVTKPFSNKELVARVKALLRRSTMVPQNFPDVWRINDVEVDFKAREAWRGEEAVEVTTKEWELLYYLVRWRGRLVKREEILRDVWRVPSDLETRTIDRHIKSLREKLEPDPSDPTFIRTVWGEGYKLQGCMQVEPTPENATTES